MMIHQDETPTTLRFITIRPKPDLPERPVRRLDKSNTGVQP